MTNTYTVEYVFPHFFYKVNGETRLVPSMVITTILTVLIVTFFPWTVPLFAPRPW